MKSAKQRSEWQLRRLVGVLICAVVLSACEAKAIGPQQLGATYHGNRSAVTFRVYSSRATRLEVWLYDRPENASEQARYILEPNPPTGIWSKTVSTQQLREQGITGPLYYGYRAWGPNWTYDPGWTKGSAAGFIADVDAQGNRFNPNKLLLDPYALESSHDPQTPRHNEGRTYASGPEYRALDSGAWAPKGIVLDIKPPQIGIKPPRAFKDDIIYEVHARGFTRNDPSIPLPLRGTYKGASLKAGYLKALGVTAIEYLPVHETQNDANDLEPSTRGSNYWGYWNYNYFAPDRRYSSDKSPGGPTREWQEMVRAFHRQGIKVYIDVVYNHTGEGYLWNNTGNVANILSWRGLDNAAYYQLTADNRYYYDNTGVGGNFNVASAVSRNLILDSLAYWKNNMGVDGFRFDLASVLGNSCAQGCFKYDKADPQNTLNRAVRELPVRPAGGGEGVDLIAEPWAIGEGTYQVGNYPPGWAEWNGQYRDTIRRVQNKKGVEPVTPAQLAMRLAGSADLYADDGRKPWHSVNFIVSHDGFTLRDLYSYNAKNNNQPWPYGPSDGGDDHNLSWDQGGDAALQRQAARTGLALLMLSAGVPMITGGDEMYRTQYGNNNAYNLDTEKNWLDYSNVRKYPNFHNYVRKILAFRCHHPALRPLDFYRGMDLNHNGLKDLTWLRDNGVETDQAYMSNPDNHFLAYRIDGSEFKDRAQSIYVAYNGWWEKITVTLPPNLPGKQWYRVGDTAVVFEGQDNLADSGKETKVPSRSYRMNGRTVALFLEK